MKREGWLAGREAWQKRKAHMGNVKKEMHDIDRGCWCFVVVAGAVIIIAVIVVICVSLVRTYFSTHTVFQ